MTARNSSLIAAILLAGATLSVVAIATEPGPQGAVTASAGNQPAPKSSPRIADHRQVGGPAAAAGDAAVTRLRAAIATRTPVERTVEGPTIAPVTESVRSRRAFDALRARRPAPAIDSRVRSAVAGAQAAAARERELMVERLGQALGIAPPDMTALARTALPSPSGFVPLLFVSSSMPLPILRSYAAQLERSGGAMAFRGMPAGLRRVQPMAKLAAEILRVDPDCEGPACAMRAVQIVVDPIAFRQHGIGRVPALAMVPGDPAQPYCERDETAPPPAGPRIFGDAALSGLFDEYARQGGAKEVRDAQARLSYRP